MIGSFTKQILACEKYGKARSADVPGVIYMVEKNERERKGGKKIHHKAKNIRRDRMKGTMWRGRVASQAYKAIGCLVKNDFKRVRVNFQRFLWILINLNSNATASDCSRDCEDDYLW